MSAIPEKQDTPMSAPSQTEARNANSEKRNHDTKANRRRSRHGNPKTMGHEGEKKPGKPAPAEAPQQPPLENNTRTQGEPSTVASVEQSKAKSTAENPKSKSKWRKRKSQLHLRTSEEIANTDTADEADQADKADKAKPGKSGKSYKSGKPDKSDKSDKPDKADKANKPDKEDSAEKSDKVGDANKMDKVDKAKKPYKSNKAKKEEKTGKVDKSNKTDKADKIDNTNIEPAAEKTVADNADAESKETPLPNKKRQRSRRGKNSTDKQPKDSERDDPGVPDTDNTKPKEDKKDSHEQRPKPLQPSQKANAKPETPEGATAPSRSHDKNNSGKQKPKNMPQSSHSDEKGKAQAGGKNKKKERHRLSNGQTIPLETIVYQESPKIALPVQENLDRHSPEIINDIHFAPLPNRRTSSREKENSPATHAQDHSRHTTRSKSSSHKEQAHLQSTANHDRHDRHERHERHEHHELRERREHKEHAKDTTKKKQHAQSDGRSRSGRRQLFDEFLNAKEVQIGLRAGTIIRGVLRINKRNRSESYVTSDDLDSDIYICGSRNRNRTLEGDIVAVHLLDVDKVWDTKKAKDRAKEAQRKKKDQAQGAKEKDPAKKSDEDKNKPKYCGRIVAIIDRAKNQKHAGILSVDRPNNSAGEPKLSEEKRKDVRLLWFKPTDKRTPMIAIPLQRAPSDILTNEEHYKNRLMLATIVDWPTDAVVPFGKIVGDLGMVGEIQAETAALLADCQIKDAPFDKLVTSCLPPTPWSIPQDELDKRLDLRDSRIFTIDPSTARDLDDAVHVVAREDGSYEVGVHIADVSHFVRMFTPLDTEARARGTSTYLVDRVIPMLPNLLCEELCSLNPGVDRLAFSVIWVMDDLGIVKSTWFGKTVIKSCAKLSYDDAQSVIEGHGLPEQAAVIGHSRSDVTNDIMHLYKLSQHMRKRRFDQGALSINSIRLSFQLNELGEPTDVWVYELKEANRLIEEFMLRANMSVAEKICKAFPEEALLRRHAPPVERRLDEFLALTESLGYTLDGSSAGSLQASLNAIDSEHVKAVLAILAIKPMQRAKYFSSGSIDISKYRHYALNIPLYTHFTSPIRRYADVIVHRQLEAALKGAKKSGYAKKLAQQIALECNRNRDGAKNAQDLHIQLYLAHYLHKLEASNGPIVRSSVVIQVASDAFDILVPEYGIEKRIHMDSLPIERFEHVAEDGSLRIYWKKGCVPSLDFVKDLDEDDDNTIDEDTPAITIDDEASHSLEPRLYIQDQDLEEPSLGKAIPEFPDTVLSTETTDSNTCMQHIKVFSKLDVLIQVSINRSPPILHVFPINPFADPPKATQHESTN